MRDSYHHRFLVIGSHQGTGITPLRWEVTKKQRVHQICACKYTKDPPYCDATHTNLPAQVLQQQEACPRQNANHHSNNKLCTGCGWVPDFWVFFIPSWNWYFFFKMEVFTNLDTCTYCYILGLVHLFTMHYIYIGSPMVCSWICLLSNEFVLAIPKPWWGDRKHITSWIKSYPTMGDSFYHMLQRHFLSLHKFYVGLAI